MKPLKGKSRRRKDTTEMLETPQLPEEPIEELQEQSVEEAPEPKTVHRPTLVGVTFLKRHTLKGQDYEAGDSTFVQEDVRERLVSKGICH